MEKWILTGISGSGRIELLNEIGVFLTGKGKSVKVYDVGELIKDECIKNNIPIVDNRLLDIDHAQIKLLRASALKEVEINILKNHDIDLHLIGLHGTFRWKSRLIPGISYQNLMSIGPHGFINVVHNVKNIFETNKKNQKWDDDTLPGIKETQDWMIEEEFTTELLAEVLNIPMYLIAREHKVSNLSDIFLTNKKKVYLSSELV